MPEDCGFDKYGLMVHREFAVTIKARAMTIPPEDGQDSPLTVCSVRIAAPITPLVDTFKPACQSEGYQPMSAEQLEKYSSHARTQ